MGPTITTILAVICMTLESIQAHCDTPLSLSVYHAATHVEPQHCTSENYVHDHKMTSELRFKQKFPGHKTTKKKTLVQNSQPHPAFLKYPNALS